MYNDISAVIGCELHHFIFDMLRQAICSAELTKFNSSKHTSGCWLDSVSLLGSLYVSSIHHFSTVFLRKTVVYEDTGW